MFACYHQAYSALVNFSDYPGRLLIGCFFVGQIIMLIANTQ